MYNILIFSIILKTSLIIRPQSIDNIMMQLKQNIIPPTRDTCRAFYMDYI